MLVAPFTSWSARIIGFFGILVTPIDPLSGSGGLPVTTAPDPGLVHRGVVCTRKSLPTLN